MKSREHVTKIGRAAFYAAIWEDLRNAALDKGWALALHGSLSSDMDIMGMPWTENASTVEEMVQSLSNCFTGSIWKEGHANPFYDKPFGRVVYTLTIWADFYVDLSVMDSRITKHG